MELWTPKVRPSYRIYGRLYREALDYARKSRAYTSDRHDFHQGGLDNKQQKMLEGKLGEKAFWLFLVENEVRFKADQTGYEERDEYDFLLCRPGLELKVDVKTRTEAFHIRTLELVEQVREHPKDLYVSARLYREQNTVTLLGWFTREDLLARNHIENLGYLDNYVMYDRELRPMEELARYCHENFPYVRRAASAGRW